MINWLKKKNPAQEIIKRSQYESVDSWIKAGLPLKKATGKTLINEMSVLGVPSLYRAVDLLACIIADLEINFVRRKNGGKEFDKSHPGYNRWRYQANDKFQSAFDVKRTAVKDRFITGDGFIRQFPDYQIANLDPYQTEAIVKKSGTIYSTIWEEKRIQLMPWEIVHLKGLGNGVVGYGLIDLFSEVLSCNIERIKFESNFFANSATPAHYIEPAPEADQAQVEDYVAKSRARGGSDNYGSFEIMPSGWKKIDAGYPLKELALNELDEQHLCQIANMMSIPRSFLNSALNSSFATWDADSKRLLGQTIQPILSDFESQLFIKVLTEEEKKSGNILVEFDKRGLEDTDTDKLSNTVISQKDHGLQSTNEGRKVLGHPPIMEAWADEIMIPENMTFVSQKLAPVAPEPEPTLDSGQIQAILTIAQEVISKALPVESAIALIAVAFPHVMSADIKAILGPLEGFEPPKQPEPPVPGPEALQEAPPEPAPEQPPEPPPSEQIARSLLASTADRMAKRIQKGIKIKGNHDLVEHHLKVLTESFRPFKENSAELCEQFLMGLQEELDAALPDQVKVSAEKLIEVIS